MQKQQGPVVKIIINSQCTNCEFLKEEIKSSQLSYECTKTNTFLTGPLPNGKCPFLFNAIKNNLSKEIDLMYQSKKTEIHKILTEIFYDSYDFEWEDENDFSIKVDAFNKNDYKKLEDSLPNYNFDLSPHSDNYFTISFGLKK